MNSETSIAFEAVWLQFHPVPGTGESLNVGVVMFSPDTHQIVVRISSKRGRVTSAFPLITGADYANAVSSIRSRVQALVGRSEKQTRLALVASLPDLLRTIAPRIGPSFSWSEAARGVCADLPSYADAVFERTIARYEARSSRPRVEARDVWEQVRALPVLQDILPEARGKTIRTSEREHQFPAAWMNGTQQVADAISLDYSKGEDMMTHAEQWSGRLTELGRAEPFFFTAVVSHPPRSSALSEYHARAVRLLQHNDRVRHVLPVAEAQRLGAIIRSDIREHLTH